MSQTFYAKTRFGLESTYGILTTFVIPLHYRGSESWKETQGGFCDPGDLPLVDPVTLHLVPSKSVHKQGSYGGKREIWCPIPDKVQDKRDTVYTLNWLLEVDLNASTKLDQVKIGWVLAKLRRIRQLDPSVAELAAGRRRKRKFGLAAEQNAASRKAS